MFCRSFNSDIQKNYGYLPFIVAIFVHQQLDYSSLILSLLKSIPF